MINDRLKPHVHKIKGAKYLAFFDVLKGDFYHFRPGGDINAVRRELKDAGLIFETPTMVPFKTKINVLERGKELVLRKLQVRIDGCGEDNCWNRKKIGCTKKKMTIYTAEKIIENLQRIPIHQLKVQAETYDRGIIFSLLKSLDFEEFHLVLEHGITDDEVELLKRRTKADVRVGNPHPFPIREIITDAYDYFYNHSFNACLGNQVAIDTQGEVRPCLWWPSEVGNIQWDNLKGMIIDGRFNRFWETTKNDIEVCKDCEYMYNCHDCRLNSINPDEYFLAKPVFCNYNPYTGEGNKETD
jgi:radical SAM protein with 4Fe4S-binding SPASM domain